MRIQIECLHVAINFSNKKIYTKTFNKIIKIMYTKDYNGGNLTCFHVDQTGNYDEKNRPTIL